MPGNVKLGSSNEPDPDPTPYLFVSAETKRMDSMKPYDPKKSVWMQEDDGSLVEGLLQSDDGNKAVVMIGHEKRTCKSERVSQMNPPKFEKCEDMSNLTYLNEASVLWNLKSRYLSKLIYTYSGLFCVVVNPYRRYPIYTPTTVKLYIGKRRNEVPPHLFAISDTAYRNMLTNKVNQSILVTGESGAGKTENTKKVIAYFAMVGSRDDKKKQAKKAASLEDQIVQTNPILEAFGNAKTARNDNSSRFGKFIRIHFNVGGKLAGCDIETYLLEKSRITQQQEVERSYHIFYQMMQTAVPNLKKKCFLSDDIYDYHFVSQGKTSVPSIDDNEDLEFTHDAFSILHFTEEETWNIYKIVASVMHMGELKFKQKGREEQCEPDDTKESKKVAALLGVDAQAMMKAFCKPKIKVGTEWVTKGQNIDQSTSSVAGIARGLYDRAFKFIVEVCNKTLVDHTMKKAAFIGVLDIAGFEIFNYNGFEQICINLCNEKLQQFFNHHTFVLEQEEYVKEGIDWAMVDFGMDLQACITMFEKPMGILSILEEETQFPKATDKTFEEKLKSNHLGKSPNFAKAITKTDKNAHFAIIHYAGIVSYNVTGWLEKNKDPLNDTVVELLKNGSNKLVVHVLADHPGQGDVDEGGKGGSKKGRKGKASVGKTVSSFYRNQLDSLMSTLYATEPHFIRCIVPNGNKMAGEIDSPMVIHQLTCNGVLEGIRICMRGFPNRMAYKEFCNRYTILETKKVAHSAASDPKTIADVICRNVIDPERYRIGHTKIFFRAGVLGYMEELRDDIIIKLVRWLQASCYGLMSRREFERRKQQREYMKVIQRNFRQFLRLRHWGWFEVIRKTKPLIGMVNIEQEIDLLESAAQKAQKEAEYEEMERKRLEQENVKLQEEQKALMQRLESEQSNLSHIQERQAKVDANKADLEVQLADLHEQFVEEGEKRTRLSSTKKNMESELNAIRKDADELEERVKMVEDEMAGCDHVIRSLNDDISTQDEIISKLNKEKKFHQENSSKTEEDLRNAEDKVQHLNMVKCKLEQTMDDLEDTLAKEKRQRADAEKNRRKTEVSLKVSQEATEELERGKKELEGIIDRRNKEVAEMVTRMEEHQAYASKLQRSIKELNGRIEDLEEEVETERQAHAKAQRQKSDIVKELDEMTERLEESSGAIEVQKELNKKREAEVARMRKDIEEVTIQQESNMSNLRKKHQDAVCQMTEQIEQLNKLKVKAENERHAIKIQTDDLKAAHDHLATEKASADKTCKSLQGQLNEANKRLTGGDLQLQDIDKANRKAMCDNAELARQLEEIEANIVVLQKTKLELTNQLDDTKRLCDDEAKERQSLLARYRNLEHEYDGNMAVYEEEVAMKDDMMRQCQKAEADAEMWKLKFEQEGIAKINDLENAKLKLQARLAECESTVANLNGKLIQLEKSKAKYQQDVEDVATKVDKAHFKRSQMEKKIKQFDKIIADWKRKADTLTQELDQAQKECRNVSSELFRLKNGYEESVNQLNEVKRENGNLTDEIKDIMEQISEGGRSIHEIEKQRKFLEAEKRDLQAALEEAESNLEQVENRYLRAQVELGQIQQEVERRIAEKDEDLEAARRNHQKQVEQLQHSLEVECKAKSEVQRARKKLEADIQELEAALDHANHVANENQKNYNKYQYQTKQSQQRLDEEQMAKEVAKENLSNMERRVHTLQNNLEEARAQLEQLDRARRTAEQELTECNENMSDLSVQNQNLVANKRHLESDLDNLRQDLDDAKGEANMVEDKARLAMMDAAKLSDELRLEQDATNMLENERRMMETTLKDLQARLDEAESVALKNGKKTAQKLENRIRELENELDCDQRRFVDSSKNFRKSERRIKDLDFQADEDRKQQEHMQDLVDKMQHKLRNFKKQIEEAEEIAAMNLAKFRQTQQQLEEAEERADLNEQALVKYRAMGGRSSRGTTPLPGQLI